jgi:DNA-binding NarL/FixJ family response regulator
MDAAPIRVLVVDDHPVVRHGLAAILRYEAGMDVVGEAADGEEALALIRERRPAVVLLDLRLPRRSGIEVMKQARAEGLPCRFLVLTTYDTDEYITPALAAGAHGYLLKDATPDELARGVRSVVQGHAALEAGVATRLLERMAEGARGDELSPRELDVLRLLVSGAGNKAIAAGLDLSENTVKTHLSRIFAKLGVQSRAEAVAIALQRGLVPPAW